jgi:hypothetical protein
MTPGTLIDMYRSSGGTCRLIPWPEDRCSGFHRNVDNVLPELIAWHLRTRVSLIAVAVQLNALCPCSDQLLDSPGFNSWEVKVSDRQFGPTNLPFSVYWYLFQPRNASGSWSLPLTSMYCRGKECVELYLPSPYMPLWHVHGFYLYVHYIRQHQ